MEDCGWDNGVNADKRTSGDGMDSGCGRDNNPTGEGDGNDGGICTNEDVVEESALSSDNVPPFRRCRFPVSRKAATLARSSDL